MNLTLHQLKKDMRRTRMVLGLWLFLVVLRFALIGWNADPGDTVMQSFFATLSFLTAALGSLLILVLVPVVIHQEPLVGTSAFWFTRPLSRPTLLQAKALFVFILLALPLVVQSIVFLANGVTAHDVVLAVPELLIEQLWWILIVATLAVLTPSFGRFVIVGASVLVVIYLVLFGIQIFRLFLHNPQALINTLPSLTQSRSLVSTLILIGFGGAVVIGQYLTRRTARSITLAVAGLILSSIAGQYWPWNFMKPALLTVPDAQFHADAIAAPVLGGRPSASDMPSLRGGESSKRVTGSIVLAGCPPGYVIRIENIYPRLKPANGPEFTLAQSQDAFFYSNTAIDPDAIEQALGGIPVVNRNNFNSGAFTTLCTLDANTYATYAQVPLIYSAQLSCVAYKCVTTAELPLNKGARFVQGSNRETITNILNQGDGVEIQMQRQTVHLLFAPTTDEDNARYSQDRQNVIYVLLNRKRREAVQQKQNNNFGNFNMFNGQDILTHQPLRLSYGPEDNQQNTVFPNLDRTWLADAVLVRLELTPVSEFTKTLTIPNFRLDGNFAVPGLLGTRPEIVADSLEKIVLPPNATREQTSDYITAILEASRRQNRFSDQDPEMEMLRQVGAQNVDLLISMAGDNHNYYLNRVINDLAQPDHKEMILGVLATNYDLIDTVVAHGWQKEAEPTLLAGLADKTQYHPEKWTEALVSLKDPATYDALKNYYIDKPYRRLFAELQSLLAFDLAGTVDQSWKKYGNSSSWQVRELLVPAAQFGETGVLDVAVKILKNNSTDGFSKQSARKVLKDYTPALGATDAEVTAWMDANGSRLSFDPTAKKFVLGVAATPPPAPAGNGTPNPGTTEPAPPTPTH